jgi:hypothetical protein
MSAIDKSPEQLEWERMQRMGRGRRRPLLIGGLAGVAAAILAAFLVVSLLDQQADEAREARERGETTTRVYVRRRGFGVGGQILFHLAAPAIAGLAAGALAFRLAGGKFSAEHTRGLKELMRD